MEKHVKEIKNEPPPGFFGIRISNLMNRILGYIWWAIFLLLLYGINIMNVTT